MNTAYTSNEPARAEIDAMEEPVVIEFGASWCGFCIAAQSPISAAFASHPHVRHIKVEDGRGRPLGRSFGVKLWPTLVFLDHGKEVARVVRPRDTHAMASALAQLDSSRVE